MLINNRPRLRDILVKNYQDYPLDNFFIPYTTTLSLNWPHESMQCLLPPSGSDEMKINPLFERHLRNLNNWSLGPAFATALPGLAVGVRIRMEGEVINSR